MKKRVFIVFIVALTLTIGSVLVSWANVNPPPVNQFLGIPDTVFNNIQEADCRACHNTNPPSGIPVDSTYLPTRHHTLVNTAVVCPTAAPNITTCPPAPNIYQCLSCHTEVPVFDLGTGDLLYYKFAPFRDCTLCHKQVADGPTVHHATDRAQAEDCKSCHGSLIQNPWAWEIANSQPLHYIPTYQPSMVTPRTGLGQTTGPLGTGQGGCAYCHNAGTDTSTGKNILVYTNGQTHHSTGLALPAVPPYSGKCLWCHDTNPGGSDDIRTCEQCHGVGSLHNIQVDSNANGIVPGQELPYYGHIGSNTDCNGCHLNTIASASAPYSGPVVPDVSGLSDYTFTEGAAQTITVDGSAFTNTVTSQLGTTIELKSKVVLTAANGSTTTLTPIVITQSSLDVTIPATLAAGNYDLRVVKADKASNPTVISVVPGVFISSATCSNSVVTIKGSGFSGYLNAIEPGTGAGTGVQLLGSSTCSVNSWIDTQIVANCGTCSGTVEVSSVFGTASKIVEDLTPPPPPCSSYQYSAWSACQPNNTQTRTYTKSPDGCIENPPPVTTQTCTYIPPTCTSFTYSAWSACMNSQQTRTVISSSPTGCVGGNPVLTQTCVSNKPPVANAGPDKSANRYSSVKFDGSASKDPDGTIAKYEWNFDDGTSGSGKVVYHKYSIRKTYTVTLKVTDNIGATATDTATVTVR